MLKTHSYYEYLLSSYGVAVQKDVLVNAETLVWYADNVI